LRIIGAAGDRTSRKLAQKKTKTNGYKKIQPNDIFHGNFHHKAFFAPLAVEN